MQQQLSRSQILTNWIDCMFNCWLNASAVWNFSISTRSIRNFEQEWTTTKSNILYLTRINFIECLIFFLIFEIKNRYIWAGLLVVLGIYLNVLSKRNKLSTKELFIKFGHLLKLPNKFRIIFEQHQKDAMFEV